MEEDKEPTRAGVVLPSGLCVCVCVCACTHAAASIVSGYSGENDLDYHD